MTLLKQGRLAKFKAAILQGKTQTQAAIDAGINPSWAHVGADRLLKEPGVREDIIKALDKAGAKVAKSARVIAEAHEANETVASKNGDIIELGPDHKTRLKAAELNFRVRGIMNLEDHEGGRVMGIGFFLIKGGQDRGLPPIDAEMA